MSFWLRLTTDGSKFLMSLVNLKKMRHYNTLYSVIMKSQERKENIDVISNVCLFCVFQVMFFTLCAERPQCQEIYKNCDLWKSFIGSSGTFRTYRRIVLHKTHIDTNAAIREDLGDRSITDHASLKCPFKLHNGPSFFCVPSAHKPSRKATANPSA